LYGDDHQLTEVGAMNLLTFWINEQGGQLLMDLYVVVNAGQLYIIYSISSCI